MTIRHYHGTPIWGNAGAVHRLAVAGAGAFVSYARPDQLAASLRYAAAVAIDNGAFSAWKRGLLLDWHEFYRWLYLHYFHPKLTFFVIPDVVEGGEADNDRLIAEMPAIFRDKAAPVWHLHESLDRLIHLCEEWPRVCFGSSGEYAVIHSAKWRRRMFEGFSAIYRQRNLTTKIHGLRMLDGRILGRWPLHSADSTTLAVGVPKYRVRSPELSENVLAAGYQTEDIKLHRCAIFKNAIESVNPPSVDAWRLAANDDFYKATA